MYNNRFENYDEAVSYILEIPRFSAKNDMEATGMFLETVGEPDAGTVIHVAGTNGKGSTCAFLNSVYMKFGKKTGLFTSPHLEDIRERIRIDNEMISKEDFLESAQYIYDKILLFGEKKKDYHPSFFEYIFFMAIRYFAKEKADVIIYETGLGGRLDATNSLSRKSVCVITQIGLDHMEYLGNTRAEIAAEKAGILMSGVPVVYLDAHDEASEVIRATADMMGCEAYQVSETDAQIIAFGNKNIDFSYKYSYYKSAMFKVHSYAQYQVCNALLAIKTLQVLLGEDCVDTHEVHEGIADMFWPGRMEEIGKGIILDGGHNADGVAAFIDSVLMDECRGSRHLIYSAVNDKQIDVISRELVGCKAFARISLCEMTGSRATGIQELKKIFDDSIDDAESGIVLTVYKDVIEAYEAEKKLLGDDDRLYICGSLYLIADIRKYIGAE